MTTKKYSADHRPTEPNICTISEMTLQEVIAEWKRQRRELFLRLSSEGMTYEAIAEKYGISRQYVGLIIKGEEGK